MEVKRQRTEYVRLEPKHGESLLVLLKIGFDAARSSCGFSVSVTSQKDYTRQCLVQAPLIKI